MRKGIFAAVGAYTIWGLFPLYWKMLANVPALEILAHRMFWSLVFVIGLLLAQGNLTWLKQAWANRSLLLRYTLIAMLLTANWGIYIWAVNSGHIVESSLGYFINPLVSIVFGMVFLKERLRLGQWLAVGLATAGVIYLTLTLGVVPWIALSLAGTFGLYGLLKKISPLDSRQGFTLETLVMLLPALAYLLYLGVNGQGAFIRAGTQTSLLLAVGGAMTAIPLLLFGSGARRIPLSMIGILQYIAPTLQFSIGVFVYHEPFPLERLVGFSLIWAALVIYMAEGLTVGRRTNP